MHATSVSACACELCSCWFWGPCFCGVPHPLWILYFFYLLFCRFSWALTGRDLMETSYLGLSVPRPLTFWLIFVCYLYICSHLLQEEASLMTAEQDTNLAEYNYESFYYYIFLSSFRPVLFGFVPFPRSIYSKVLDNPCTVGCGLQFMEWVLSQISLVGYYHKFCATVPSNILQIVHHCR